MGEGAIVPHCPTCQQGSLCRCTPLPLLSRPSWTLSTLSTWASRRQFQREDVIMCLRLYSSKNRHQPKFGLSLSVSNSNSLSKIRLMIVKQNERIGEMTMSVAFGWYLMSRRMGEAKVEGGCKQQLELLGGIHLPARSRHTW